MRRCILDTNMIRAYLRAENEHFNRRSERYLGVFSRHTISILTYYEVLQGIEYHAMASNREVRMRARRRRKVLELFRQTHEILDISVLACKEAAKLSANYHARTGNLPDPIDTIIAGLALAHDYTVVTENEKHFVGIDGLIIENWLKP